MNKHLEQHKGVIALIVLAFVWGLIAILGRYFGGYFSLFQQLYLINAVAFIFSLFLFEKTLKIQKLKKIPAKDWFIMIFRVIVGYFIGASLYREALLLTKIGNVTFMQSIPFTAVFGWVLFKEKFNWVKLLLVIISFIGVVMIAVQDISSVYIFGKGEVLSLLSTVLFALTFLSRKYMTNFLNDKEITQILLSIGVLVPLVASIIIGESMPVFNWTWGLFIMVLLAGILGVSNIFLLNYGYNTVKLVLANNLLTLEVVFALLLAFIFYKELPTLKELLGGLLILGSVIQMNRLEENTV